MMANLQDELAEQRLLEAARKIPEQLAELAVNAKSAKVRQEARAAMERYASSHRSDAAKFQAALAKLPPK